MHRCTHLCKTETGRRNLNENGYGGAGDGWGLGSSKGEEKAVGLLV